MKTKRATCCLLIVAMNLCLGGRSFAGGYSPVEMGLDAVLARPVSLLATVAGSAVFVITLPFSLASRTTHETARVFVVAPAKDTFTRPLGDLDDFLKY